jgi:hypothetical protein
MPFGFRASPVRPAAFRSPPDDLAEARIARPRHALIAGSDNRATTIIV